MDYRKNLVGEEGMEEKEEEGVCGGDDCAVSGGSIVVNGSWKI